MIKQNPFPDLDLLMQQLDLIEVSHVRLPGTYTNPESEERQIAIATATRSWLLPTPTQRPLMTQKEALLAKLYHLIDQRHRFDPYCQLFVYTRIPAQEMSHASTDR